ncbi:MAG: apolipoprotein N-acyltransferase [Flavobacteriaceae bacterium]
MITLNRKHRYLLSILSGILMVISYPYSGSLTPIVFIAWVPLLFVESYITKKRYKSRKVFAHAYLTFLIYNVGTTWWIINADEGGAILAFVANSLLMSIAFYLFHLTKKHVGSKEGYLSLLIYWIAFEYLHFNWDASWTWLTLGNTFSIQPAWVQWYSYTGVLGGSMWVLLVNLLVFRIYNNVWMKQESWRIQTPLVWMASFFLLVPFGISLIQYFSYEEQKRPVEIVIVQPNIDPYNMKFDMSTSDAQIEQIISLAKKKVTKNTDLILAPETAIAQPIIENNVKSTRVYNYLKQQKHEMYNVPLCIGASTSKYFEKKNSRASRPVFDGPGFIEYYNTTMLITENDNVNFVHKSKLVPGVEGIPFSETFPFLEDIAIENGGTSGTLGIEDAPRIMWTNKFRFAPVVCYESIYGEWVTEQCRLGAELICITTNDGWWKDSPGYKQHMSFASLRAIENRRSVARSANTGTSAFVNQRGDILQATDWWEPAVIKGTINLNSEKSFYTTYGNVLGRSLAFVSVLLILFTFVKRFKRAKEIK